MGWLCCNLCMFTGECLGSNCGGVNPQERIYYLQLEEACPSANGTLWKDFFLPNVTFLAMYKKRVAPEYHASPDKRLRAELMDFPLQCSYSSSRVSRLSQAAQEAGVCGMENSPTDAERVTPTKPETSQGWHSDTKNGQRYTKQRCEVEVWQWKSKSHVELPRFYRMNLYMFSKSKMI